MSAVAVPGVEGTVDDAFAPVAEAFAADVAEIDAPGAACAVVHRGRLVVDLWGGSGWSHDSVANVFSCTKGAVAACANLLLGAGELDLDAPVARWWPEFAAAGKADVTVGQALSHQAGIPALDRRPTIEEVVAWDPVVAMVAAQAPEWEPGTAHGYHAVTWGWIVGELVRRVTGQTVGAFFRERIADPLGLDWWIGIPPEVADRVVDVVDYPGGSGVWGGDPAASLMARAVGMIAIADFNRPDVRAAEIPAGNGTADARSMARFYAALPELLGPEQFAVARTPLATGPDQVLAVPGVGAITTSFGPGFMLGSGRIALGGPGSIGHNGAGGSLAFLDPERELAVAYVPRQMLAVAGGDPRAGAVVDAAYAAMDNL